MRAILNRICLSLAVVCFICLVGLPVWAASDLPDSDRSGSISVTMKNTDTGEIVSGGSLAVYRIADAVEANGDYTFQFTDAFSDCGLSLENLESEKLASALASYAAKKGSASDVQEIREDGKVTFLKLDIGLYLIVQQSAAEGYRSVSPFLVSVPMQSEEGWIYDVDASPKAELIKEQPQFPAEPSAPGQDPGTDNPETGVTKLPQTGQLNWPVPVLAVAGILLFAFGWTLNNTKRKTDYEA